MDNLTVSQETIEALHAFVAQHCTSALEEPTFLPGLVAVVEAEVRAAVQAERSAARRTCWRFIRKAGVPCRK